ncbi:MAG: EF-P beta-lysylation protein EpmB [Planctomycetaceae bacterium]|nr:EF-P beta-lysylation protein EpmB [Planctomycetaceae bacterium]
MPDTWEISRARPSPRFLQPVATDWSRSLAAAIRDPDALIDRLALPQELREPARRAAGRFPLLVPDSYLRRIQPGNPADPLLLQVLPLDNECHETPGFVTDPVGDHAARTAPGLLHKYAGRALLVATGSCAVHCRYCFRREYPYQQEPRRLDDWLPALDAIAADDSLHEVILSGGDPLMLTDTRLEHLIQRLAQIPHLRRLRIHSRLPVVLPDRVSPDLLQLLRSTRLTPIMVVHANHPAEIVDDCRDTLVSLVQSGVTTLNQAVLLQGVNDNEDVLADLCERLIDIGVLPYYLHQLDRVRGAAHFEVAEARGLELIDELRRRLPGYAVPRYVREVAGAASKTVVEIA